MIDVFVFGRRFLVLGGNKEIDAPLVNYRQRASNLYGFSSNRRIDLSYESVISEAEIYYAAAQAMEKLVSEIPAHDR